MKGGKAKAEQKDLLRQPTDKKIGKGKAVTEKQLKQQAKKNKKAKKDPNKPKRPPSAFFVFMDEFRKEYKEAHPNTKSVAVVGKAAGEKWKSMTGMDKAPYETKAAKKKSEYEKAMEAYNNKQEGFSQGGEESDKSKSEVNNEEESEEEEDDDK